MAEIRTIGIKFDPTDAKRGADEAKKAVKDMATSVDRDLQKVETAGREAGNIVQASGQKIVAGADKSRVAIDRLGNSRGFQRMATGARTSAGQVSNGLIDMLDTFGLLDSGIGRMVRRVQSGINSVGNFTRLFAGARGTIAATGTTAATAGASMASAGTGAASMATGVAAAATGMGALGTAAAVLLPIIAALAVAFSGFLAIAGVWSAFKAGSPLAGEFERTKIALEALTGSATEADRVMEEMRATWERTGVEVSAQARTIQKFLALGFSVDDATKLQRNILDVAGAVGMTTAEADLLGSALAQVKAKGVVSMEELRQQIAEKGVPVFEELAKKIGVSQGALIEMVSAGKVPAQDLIDIFLNMEGSFARFEGGAEKLGSTWGGMLARIGAQWRLLLADFAAPINEALKPALGQAIEWLKSMRPLAVQFGQALADGVTGMIQIFRSGQVEEFLKLGLLAAFEFAAANYVTLMLLAVQTVLEFMAKGFVNAVTLPVRLFVTIFSGAVDILTKLLEGDFSGAIAVVTDFFQRSGVGVLGVMGATLYNVLGKAFEDVVNIFATAWFTVLQKGADLISKGLVAAGKDPLAPVALPGRISTFTPKDTSFKVTRDAANDLVGTGARDNFAAFFDEMVKKAKGNGNTGTNSPFSGGDDNPLDPTTDIAGGVGKAGGGRAGGVDKATEALKAQQTQLEQLMQDWADLGNQIDQVAAASAQSIAGNLTDSLYGIATGAVDAKTAFAQMANAIISDILRMILQMTVQLALQRALGGIAGGGGAGILGSLGAAHSGGTVGATNLSTTGNRSALPTFHSGGMSTSEQTVKVERGESILTRKRAKELEMELAAQRGEKGTQSSQGNQATIINVTDRKEMADAVVAHPESVMNVISRQLPAVRKMVMSGNRL